MRLLILLFILSSGFISCIVPVQSADGYAVKRMGPEKGMPTKPGACYAKCLIPDEYITHNEELAVFTGDPDNTDARIEEIEFVISSGKTEWVKKKADKNCLSANPEDCLVWCLVDVPGETEKYIVVLDTTTTDEYRMVTRETKELVKSGGHTEWREILCAEKISKELISNLQNYLFAQGLYLKSIDGNFNIDTKNALKQFQLHNKLPMGQIDLGTLDFMGINF